MEDAPVAEVVPMDDVRPVERVTTMYEAVSAAMEGGRRTKTATVDRNAAASEPATAERRPAAPESATMERRTTAPESTAMKPAAAETTATAAKATASTAAETAAAGAAMLNLGRQSVGCKFR